MESLGFGNNKSPATMRGESVGAYAARVFLMAAAGFICALTVGIVLSRFVMPAIGGPDAPAALVFLDLVPFIILFVLASIMDDRLDKVSVASTRWMSAVFILAVGATCSRAFSRYGLSSIMAAVGIAGAYFVVMAALSWFLKWDLEGLVPILTAGTCAIILATVVACFLRYFTESRWLEIALLYASVGLAVAFTATDTSLIRKTWNTHSEDPDAREKHAAVLSLHLMMDLLIIALSSLGLTKKRND